MVLNIKSLKFNPKYFICDKGFVISTTRGLTILKPRMGKHGYTRVYLRDVNTHKRKDYKLHRLVAEYFLDNDENFDIVNHIDGNKANNHVENLEWCTQRDNNLHAYAQGLSHSKKCPIICTTNGKIYPSQSEASNELNISRSAINAILKGEFLSMKGLHFEYVDEDWRLK